MSYDFSIGKMFVYVLCEDETEPCEPFVVMVTDQEPFISSYDTFSGVVVESKDEHVVVGSTSTAWCKDSFKPYNCRQGL